MNRILLLLVGLLQTILCNSQTTTAMTYEQQKEYLIQMAKKERVMYDIPKEQPMYFVQVNKIACRLIVKVNDIPLGYYFTEDAGQTMLYPVNDHLFSSGKHTFSIDVYPRSNEKLISDQAWVNVKLIRLPEKSMSLVPHAQTLEELELPSYIGEQKLSFYTHAKIFVATVPFNYSKIIEDAQDLRDIPNLEQQVVHRFNQLRQALVDFDAKTFFHAPYKYLIAAMSYLTEEDLVRIYLSSLNGFFNPDVLDREVEEIDNYELIICGNGKFVLLRHKKLIDNVLSISFYKDKENKIANPNNPWIRTTFVGLFMPKDSDTLEVFY